MPLLSLSSNGGGLSVLIEIFWNLFLKFRLMRVNRHDFKSDIATFTETQQYWIYMYTFSGPASPHAQILDWIWGTVVIYAIEIHSLDQPHIICIPVANTFHKPRATYKEITWCNIFKQLWNSWPEPNLNRYETSHNEAWTKWPPLCRLETHFLDIKVLYFD